jgi:hypothetical protein
MSEQSSAPNYTFPATASNPMNTQRLRAALCASVLAFLYAPVATVFAQAPTPVTVPTWRYDNTHSGANTSETALTPANVNVNSFGKLFSLPVDSTMYAQPLYVPALTIGGQVHNVVFAATENDSVYAFDADSNGGSNAAPLWKVTLLDAKHGAGPGATAIPTDPSPEGIATQGDIGPTIGITGTPVISPATKTMYVVSNTVESGTYFSRLHAINILTGAEQAGSPVAISATVSGTGTGSSGGQLAFDPLVENQRPALALYNGYVYIAYAAHSDLGAWHGWIFAYNASTLAQSAALCLSPNGEGVGIWSSGAGLPIDEDAAGGRMFAATGNNGKQTTSSYPPLTPQTQLGESVVDFGLANGGITATDAFSPFNVQTLDNSDLDLGSGGILMLPDQQGPYPHILLATGKEGRITVLNRDKLGGNNTGNSSDPTALQEITGQIKGGLWSTPAYWNGHVYLWGSKDSPKVFSLTNGVLSTTPTSQSSIQDKTLGATFSISSNGTQDGIAWAVKFDDYATYGDAVLYAWNANDLTTPIYESDTNATRDNMGIATKFAVPVVTNGKVYVVAHGLTNGNAGSMDVYGLLNAEPSATAPTISPDGGSFGAAQTVTLATPTPSAQIFYTLDDSTPTTASTAYTAPFNLGTDATVKAMASAAGYIQSSITSATFTFTNQTPPISFSPAAGSYGSAQNVTLTDADSSAKIYYTTDGSTPSASSILYTGPITVAITETINAIAIDPSLVNSNVATAAYTIQAGGTTINFKNGFGTITGLTLNGNAVASNDSRLQLTDGGLNEASSVFWNSPINIQAFTSVFNFQLSEAQANGFTFTIQNQGPTALGGDSAGLGYQNIQKSIAIKFNFYNYNNEGSDSTGFYTNGEAPLTPTVDISPSGIQLNSDDGITATVTYDGTTLTLNLLDGVTGDKFSYSAPENIPQIVGGNTAYVGFTGGSGGLSASQKISSWTYTTQAVPPAFTPAAGTYTTAQSVALSSGTSDAVIYYTTNGTAPSAGSTKYSAPISIETSETLEAVAISSTMGTSVVENAAYVINAVTGRATFSMSATSPAAIAPGRTGTSMVTITPSGGFTGTVTVSCSLTSGPAGAVDSPACSITQPGAISGSASVTSTLTLSTTAASTTALRNPLIPLLTFGGGSTLAALAFFWLPARRRKWQSLAGLLLISAITFMAIGCSSSTHAISNGGTTAGTYTFTVTGVSGSATAATTVTSTVQ